MQHINFRNVRNIVLFTLIPLYGMACDVCGAFIGVTPYDNQSGFSLYHRYGLFSHVPAGAGQHLFPGGAYRVSPVMSSLHTTHDSAALQPGDFESYKTIELRGKWFVHERVEINGLLPFHMMRTGSKGAIEKISGAGDVNLWVGFHLVKRLDTEWKQRLIVGAGIKLPTGNDDRTEEDGTRYHLYMQPGTGSVDETAYLQYTLGWRTWGLSCNATLKRSGENQYGEQIALSSTSTLNVFYMIRKGKTVLLPQVQMYAEQCSGYTAMNVTVPDSDIGLVMAGAGCDSYFGRLGVHLSLQIPAIQLQHDDTPGATFRGSLGISWNINQQKFIFN